MMKRLFSLLLVIVMFTSMFNITVFAGTDDESMTYEDYSYSVVDDEAVITGYNGDAPLLIIPDTIEEYSVTAISDGAFSDAEGIYGISIPEGVTEIGSEAFFGCTALEYVDLPSTLILSDDVSFDVPEECVILVVSDSQADEYLTDNDLPVMRHSLDDKAVEYGEVGSLSFVYNTMTNKLYLYGEGTVNDSFYNCAGISSFSADIKEIKMFDGITGIGSSAFSGCNKLSGILEIPDSVTSIGSSAFSGCNSIDNVKLPKDIERIEDYTFYNCSGIKGEFIIPDNVTYIGKAAFRNCRGIDKLVIGESVNSICTYYDYSAFNGMNSLTEMTFKCVNVPSFDYGVSNLFNGLDAIETIYVPEESYSEYVSALSPYTSAHIVMGSDDDYVIENGGLLQYTGTESIIVIPDNVESIGEAVFAHNPYLESVTLGENVKSVGKRAFYDCPNLSGLSINDGIMSIGDYAFADCPKIGEVEIHGCSEDGNALTEIGAYAFSGDSYIESLTLVNVKSIGNSAFYNCAGIENMDLGSVESIGDRAFCNCTGLNGELVIPESVTSIGNYAFYGCTGIGSVDLGNVATIGNNAFYNCTGISGVLVLPDSVTSVGNYAFYGCSEIESIDLGCVETIGNSAFYNCTGINGTLEIPDTVTSLGNYAFSGCSSVKSLIIGDAVSCIASSYGTFNDMDSVTAITITSVDASLLSDGASDFFSGFDSLKKVYVPEEAYSDYVSVLSEYTNARIVIDSEEAFVISDGVLLQYTGTDTDVIIPDNVVRIGESAFAHNSDVESVILGANVEYIDTSAFCDCTNLISVTFNDKLKNIGDFAFASCPKIEEIDIPGCSVEGEAVTEIGYSAFDCCYGISSVDLRNVKTIGAYAFSNCSSIKSLDLGSVVTIGESAFSECYGIEAIDLGSVETIGTSAFAYCSGLSGELVIPDSVKSVGDYAFYECGSIESLDLGSAETVGSSAFAYCSGLSGELVIPDSVKSIGDYAFYECDGIESLDLGSVETIGSYAFAYCSGISGEFVIPDSVKSVGDYAFYGCGGIESLDLGSVETIGSYAFAYCSGISGELVIPDSVKSIADSAFIGCSGIESLDLGSVETIGDSSFCDCTGLKGELVIPDTVTYIGGRAFCNCSSVEKLIIGESVSEIYTYYTYYGQYSAFYEMSSLTEIVFKGVEVPTFTNDASCLFDGLYALKTIRVPREAFREYVSVLSPYTNARILMDTEEDYVIEDGVLLQYTGTDKNIVIPDDVVSIGEAAFAHVNEIESVTLGANVKSIGNRAFYDCKNLETVTFNDKLTDIGDYAFSGCSSLSGQLVMPDRVTAIGNRAFEECSGIDSVDLNNVKTIGSYAFFSCTGIETLDLGSTVSIGNYAFYHCSAISGELELPVTVTSIGNSAFAYCSRLSGALVIPDRVKTIGASAFENCTSITGLTLPKDLEAIESCTFYGCNSIEGDLIIPDKVTFIGDCAFYSCKGLENLVIGERVEYIDYGAFYGLNSLTEITFRCDVELLYNTWFEEVFGIIDEDTEEWFPYGNDGSPITLYIPKKWCSEYLYELSNCLEETVARVRTFDCDDDFVVDNKKLLLYQGSDSTVVIPEEITEIGTGAFLNSDVERVIFNNKLNDVNDRAFYRSKNLTDIAFNDGLETIGESSFAGCNSLNTILALPGTVKTVGSYAFYECTSLPGIHIVGAVEDDRYVTEIGSYAFYGDSSLSMLNLGNVHAIGSHAFENCTALSGDLVIPPSVETIDDYAFRNCSSLTGFTLPDSITQINTGVFYDCTGITGDIIIPDSVRTVSDYAFFGCNKVTGIVIGSGVTSLGYYNSSSYSPFRGMKDVREVVFRGSSVPGSYNRYAFYDMDKLETIYVPAEAEDEYRNAFGQYVHDAVFSTDSLRYEVKNLHAANIYSTAVKLSWNEHANEDVESYVLLRDGEEIATTGNLYYIDYDLETGREYTYSVYGVTDLGEETATATIKLTPHNIVFKEITTYHPNNTIAPSDGRIVVKAQKEANTTDLYGNPIYGKLYYIKNGEKEFIDRAQGITAADTEFVVDWDVSDIDEGEYEVVFVYTDPGDVTTEFSGTVNVYKHQPEKIINVVALGGYDDITVSWSRSSEVDSNTYMIYRRSENESDFSLLATIDDRDTLSYIDEDVENDKIYYYYVVAADNFGILSEQSDIAFAMRAVDTESPTVTVITPANYSYICGSQTITIKAVDNLIATRSELYYRQNEGEWILISGDPRNPFRFVLDTTNLSDGETEIKALAFDANGNQSEAKTVKYYVDNTGPAVVTGLTATSITASGVSLKWNDVSDDDVESFTLQRKENNRDYVTVATGITTLGYNLENLKPDTEYTIRVAAVDTRGNMGAYSEELAVTTAKDTIPPTITELSPTASRIKSNIYFTARAGDDCAIKFIYIQTSRNLNDWETVSKAEFSNANKTAVYSCNIDTSGLSDGSFYVRAIAEDYSGNLSPSDSSAAFVEYMIDNTSPSIPRGFMAVGGDRWIYLSWIQGDEEDLDTYSLFRSTSKDSGYTLIASGLQQIDYYDTTVQRDTVYYYQLAVLDSVGNVSEMAGPVSSQIAHDVEAPEVLSVSPESNSNIGAQSHTVQALVKDNNCVDYVDFEMKVNQEQNFRKFNTVSNVNSYMTVVSSDIPLEGLKDGDKVYVRISCTDIVGLVSEYSYEYEYNLDGTAPVVRNPSLVQTDGIVSLTWEDGGEEDLAGFKIYRINAYGSSTLIGSRPNSSSHQYSINDNLQTVGSGDYVYRIVAFDKVGNSGEYLTRSINYTYTPPEPVNQAPKAVINGMADMEVGVEEYFDAYASVDDAGIVSYAWSFGDGTVSSDIRPHKRYKTVGTFTVTLTVADEEGLTDTTSMTVTVREREAIGTLNVRVEDESGSALPYAPVYFYMGTEKQKMVYSDASGTVSYKLESGSSTIGSYKSGYLPVTKEVTVLSNAVRTVTLTLVEEEIVTGRFEVHRMTFSEIQEAGIDIYDPANQNVYKVRVELTYKKTDDGGVDPPDNIPPRTIRPFEFVITPGGYLLIGPYFTDDDPTPNKPDPDIVIVPLPDNNQIIAVLDTSMAATTLKEFFSVSLHIINNASSSFMLRDNTIDLSVPDGLTVMNNLTGDWSNDVHVEFDSLRGQETHTTSWVLRGDKIGEYNLEAEYHSTLSDFEEPVSAVFRTDEPIKVYGMSDFSFEIEANSTIEYNALYFNVGLKNNGTIDYYNPMLDFDGIVINLISSASGKSGESSGSSGNGYSGGGGGGGGGGGWSDEDLAPTGDSGSGDGYSGGGGGGGGGDLWSDVDTYSYALLNVRYVTADGKTMYCTYNYTSDGKIETDTDTLSPGDTIYYDYVAYNAIDYDGIAYFESASYEVLEGYGAGVNFHIIDMNLYSLANPETKLNEIREDDSPRSSAVDYLLDNDNYISVANCDKADSIGEHLYNDLDILLTLDFSSIDNVKTKKKINDLLYTMMMDPAVEDNINRLIDTQYIKATKNVFSLIETFFSSYKFYDKDNNGVYIPKTEGYRIASIASDLLKNEKELIKVSEEIKQGGEADLMERMLVAAGLSGSLVYIKRCLSDELFGFGESSALFKGLAGLGKYGGILIDTAILNPIKSLNDVNERQYLYTMLRYYACREESLLLLNTILSLYGSHKNDFVFADPAVHRDVNDFLDQSGIKYKSLLFECARDLREQIINNSYDYIADLISTFAMYSTESMVKLIIKETIKALSLKASIFYAILGTGFELIDEAFNLEKGFEAADTYLICAYISQAMILGYSTFERSYGNPNCRSYLQDSNLFYSLDGTLDDSKCAEYALMELKFLVKSRLLGEHAFKEFIADDNGTIIQSDKDFDKEAVNKINEKFGIYAADIEEAFDYIYGRILSARDAIFTVEEGADIVKPDAPTVTIDYVNSCTNQVFDKTYEYCTSNGEWRSCSGRTIPVTIKECASILRVRKKSADGIPAGEITTVTVFAKPKLSKLITASYDSGVYRFTNLNSKKQYDVSVVDSLTDVSDFSHAVTISGGSQASASGLPQSDFLAIRSTLNEELLETYSVPLIVPVEKRQKLRIITEGNGSVVQTRPDSMYFKGDDITLNAVEDNSLFVGWYINGQLVSKDDTYLLEMYDDAAITAKFDIGNVVPAESITLSLGGGYSSVGLIDNLKGNIAATGANTEGDCYVGTKKCFEVEFTPSNTTDKTITWSSSNEDVLTVDRNGVITAKSAGTSTVTAVAASGVRASYTVRVLTNTTARLCVETLPYETYYSEGEVFNADGMTVLAQFTDGTIGEITDYTLSDVDMNTAGEKTVTVSKDNRTAEFTITVDHTPEWVTTVAPTCHSEGLSSCVCQYCSQVLDTESIPVSDHNYEWTLTKDASESEDGILSYKCKVCGDVSQTKPLPAHEHDYVVTVIQPTCTKNGYEVHKCSVCGYSYEVRPDAEAGTHPELLATQHQYDDETVEASCSQIGYTKHTCSVCGDTYIDNVVDKTEHSFAHRTIAPTCEHQGYDEEYCTVCGESIKSNYTDKLAHIYHTQQVEATCEHGAGLQYTCESCGQSYIEGEGEKLNHDYEIKLVSATCTQDGYTLHTCKNCGESYKSDIVKTTGHSFGEWMVRVPSSPDRRGQMYRICTRCSEEETKYTEKSTHVHQPGEMETVADASCEEYGVTAVCCTLCGEMIESKMIAAIGHDYVESTVAPSCTEKGYTLYTCEHCGDSYRINVVPAKGHSIGDWEITKEPDCVSSGLRIKTCTECGEILQQERIDALGHVFNETVIPPTSTTAGYTLHYCVNCDYHYEDNFTIPYNYIIGDADGNGEVEVIDVTYIQRFLAQMDTPFTKAELIRGDVDDSGDLEIIDATLIQRYLVGFNLPYPVGEMVKASSEDPTSAPTTEPTVVQTYPPTAEPTVIESYTPTVVPTVTPTIAPTVVPTVTQTIDPTVAPTVIPTIVPTATPTSVPTSIPTAEPTTYIDHPVSGDYVYKLVNTVMSGKKYLIVNSNETGSAYALKNDGGSSRGTSLNMKAVTISSGDVSDDCLADLYIFNPSSDLIWSAKKNGEGFDLINGANDYIESKGGKVSIYDSQQYPDRRWKYQNSQLQYTGGSNTFTLYYGDDNFTSTYNSTNEKVYLYEMTSYHPEYHDTVSIGFTADVHDNTDALRNWLTAVQDKYDPDLDAMVYGGDYSYQFTKSGTVGAFNDIVSITDELVGEGKGCYTTGNHEYMNASGIVEEIQDTPGFKIFGEQKKADNYIIFAMGARSASDGYTDEDIEDLDEYLSSAPTDIPIFINAHFPLHTNASRTTKNADKLIEVLNRHRNVIFLWAHNHSQLDPHYGEILYEGDSIMYDKEKSAAEINFTYLASGALYRDSQVKNNSGLVATVSNDGSDVTFRYYRASTGQQIGSSVHICITYYFIERPTEPSTQPLTGPTVIADDFGGSIYTLTDTVIPGAEYLIVSSDTAGSAYALKNADGSSSGTSVDDYSVTISSSDIDNDGVAETYIATAPSSTVWYATANGDGFNLTNDADYLECKNGDVKTFSEQQYPERYYTYADQQLKYVGGRYPYTVYYSDGFTLTNNETDEKIYLFEKTGIY